MSTFFARKEDVNSGDIERKWWIVDAEGQTLGRIATQIDTIVSSSRTSSARPGQPASHRSSQEAGLRPAPSDSSLTAAEAATT